IKDKPKKDLGIKDKPKKDLGIKDKPKKDLGIKDKPKKDLGITEESKKKKSDLTRSIKATMKKLRQKRSEALASEQRELAAILRRRISRLKKKSRRVT
ncbi:MAG: hypothetical protein GY874_19065, partial [Desulfobacteraceae bacterium]|nr:hypothetical protein [Desulfobacteraceae bacterium]